MTLVNLLAAMLLGCSDDPNHVASLDSASLEELSNSGAPIASMRRLLSKRKYKCADLSGPFTPPDGASVAVPRYIQCSKTLRDGLFCDYQVQVDLVPAAAGGVGTYFIRRRTCP